MVLLPEIDEVHGKECTYISVLDSLAVLVLLLYQDLVW